MLKNVIIGDETLTCDYDYEVNVHSFAKSFAKTENGKSRTVFVDFMGIDDTICVPSRENYPKLERKQLHIGTQLSLSKRY